MYVLIVCTFCSMMLSLFFFLMIRRPPRSTLDRSSAASDVYKRQPFEGGEQSLREEADIEACFGGLVLARGEQVEEQGLSLIHISEPTRPY